VLSGWQSFTKYVKNQGLTRQVTHKPIIGFLLVHVAQALTWIKLPVTVAESYDTVDKI
jgi:hypothetical protein